MKKKKGVKIALLILFLLSGSLLFSCQKKSTSSTYVIPSYSFDRSSSLPESYDPILDLDTDQKSVLSHIYIEKFAEFEFTPKETKTYYFVCTGGDEMVIDLFLRPITDFQLPFRSYKGGFLSTYPGYTSNEDRGCYFSRLLDADQTIYIRIRNGNYQLPKRIYFAISNDPIPSTLCKPLPHEHNYYEKYLWENQTVHQSYCECGESTFQSHVVSAGSSTCLFCGGKANIGFTGPFLLSVKYTTENGSFRLPNGVVVLDDRDIDPYLSAKLSFHDNTSVVL